MNKYSNLAASVVAVLSCSAWADKIGIEEITVLGHNSEFNGRSLSASEGIVSQQDLLVRPLLRTGEILEAVPGLVATQHSGSGKANQYFLRGFNLDHGTDFATSIDGMPINMRSHGHGQGYTDLNFIIPELVGGIHYKKGSYYADVGDFSGAGSARIATAEETEERLSIGVGQNEYFRTLATGDIEMSGGNLLLAVEHQTYAGPWQDVDEDLRKTNVWLKQRWQSPATQIDLMLMTYDSEWNSADQIPERAVEQGLITELGSIDPTLGGNSSRYSLSTSILHQLDQENSLTAHAYLIDYDMRLWSNFTYFTQPEGDQFEQLDERVIAGGDLSWTNKGAWLKRESLQTFGLEIRHDDIGEVGLYPSQARNRTGVVRSDAVTETSLSGYWQNLWQLSQSTRASLGLRYDHFIFEVDPIDAADPSTLTLNDGKVKDGIVTSSLSLVHQLDNQNELYASAGQGFHSNDARGVTLQVDPVTGESLAAADPLVDTLGFELGWRLYLKDRLNVSVALWQLQLDSELLFVGDEGTTEDTGVGSHRQGLEATAYYQINHHWTVDFEYAYTQAQFDRPLDGSRNVPGALEEVVTAGIHWQYSDRVFTHLRVRHLAPYPLDGDAQADASTLVNLRSGYQLSKNLKLTLDLLNLLDSRDRDIEYYYASQLAGESEPVYDHHYHVFEPRTARLYLELSF